MNSRFKMSYKQKRIPPQYAELEEQVRPFAKDTAFRWSLNGVPHLLVELGKGVVYSLCYFKRYKSWRVFFPYGTGDQQKQDFTSTEDMIKFLRRHKPIQVNN